MSISSLSARLTILESALAALMEENASLKTKIPLSAFTAGLMEASREEVEVWYSLCNKRATELGISTAPSKDAKEAKKEKRTPTNPSGPKEWNARVLQVWKSLVCLAVGDEIPDDMSETDFKEVAKAAGITYQDALSEAAILKRMEEKGQSREAAEAELSAAKEQKKEKKEPKEPKKEKKEPKPKTKTAPKKAEKVEEVGRMPPPTLGEEEDPMAAAFAESGLIEMEIQGCQWYVEADTMKVYTKVDQFVPGDAVGIYDMETDTIDYSKTE
jgi:hypothetical protein